MTDYEFNLRQMREALAEMAKKYPLLSGLVYTSPYDFLAQHGRDYRPIRWSWGADAIGVQKHCYGNAIANAAKYGMKYIEGVALSPVNGEIILHGWNALPGGELFDGTWANTGLVYIGVEFSIERADDATWNGDGHILNAENQGYPVFQKRWEGEDYNLQWPFSDRIEAYRIWRETGVCPTPPSVAEWLRSRPMPENGQSHQSIPVDIVGTLPTRV